jgi:hypothetical protein
LGIFLRACKGEMLSLSGKGFSKEEEKKAYG